MERDVRRLFPDLQLETYRRFVRMMSLSSGQLINYSQFAKSLDVSSPTIKNYFDIAEGSFLWRKRMAFEKNLGKRLVKMPKGHIRDSGLLCFLMNIFSAEHLENSPQYGNIFESFVVEEIVKTLNANLISCHHYHYRTSNQAEIDLILEGSFGLIPFEIKSGMTLQRKQLITLKDFIDVYKCPVGFVINNAEKIEKISDKLYQIPISYL
ncbi:MAG: DUF4143 domain-containing protein [Bdellovibrionota bacterium]